MEEVRHCSGSLLCVYVWAWCGENVWSVSRRGSALCQRPATAVGEKAEGALSTPLSREIGLGTSQGIHFKASWEFLVLSYYNTLPRMH